jgi:hypothetical protein
VQLRRRDSAQPASLDDIPREGNAFLHVRFRASIVVVSVAAIGPAAASLAGMAVFDPTLPVTTVRFRAG